VTDFAIEISELTKIFKVWNKPGDMIVEALTGRKKHTDFCALDSVSFKMRRGSVLGVLGRNGAGKSTLLRLVAGTLEQTRGTVVTHGRIASILELGTGFHPEYSGRENVFLGGMCLGLSRSEIKQKFDEIVEFSELAEFIDRPFRTYSSGMQARLTFAVATSIDPDILIIDEALAVGDARFSLKSFDRIREFRRRGKAILLVSHDINTVSSFCDEAILLERGKLIAKGVPPSVCNYYHELLFNPTKSVVFPSSSPQARDADETAIPDVVTSDDAADNAAFQPLVSNIVPLGGQDLKLATDEAGDLFLNDYGDGEDHLRYAASDQFRRYGDRAVEIVRFRIVDSQGRTISRLKSLEHYRFHMRLRAQVAAKNVGVGVLIRTTKGMQVFAANSLEPTPTMMRSFEAGEEVDVVVPFDANMGHGSYFASAITARVDGHKHDAQFDVLEFSVEQTGCHDESITNLKMSFSLSKRTPQARAIVGSHRR
jgi:lipopolysaccharide transport system ATP-binding protein